MKNLSIHLCSKPTRLNVPCHPGLSSSPFLLGRRGLLGSLIICNPILSNHASSLEVPEIFSHSQSSVVTVVDVGATASELVALSSGIVWDTFGHIIVPYQALKNRSASLAIKLEHSTDMIPVQTVAADPTHELGLLRADDSRKSILKPLHFLDSHLCKVGQDVYLKGGDSLNKGVLSAKDRSLPLSNNTASHGLLQSDVIVRSDTLGGALLDTKGRLIGMPLLLYGYSSTAVHFFISSTDLANVVPKLIIYGTSSDRR